MTTKCLRTRVLYVQRLSQHRPLQKSGKSIVVPAEVISHILVQHMTLQSVRYFAANFDLLRPKMYINSIKENKFRKLYQFGIWQGSVPVFTLSFSVVLLSNNIYFFFLSLFLRPSFLLLLHFNKPTSCHFSFSFSVSYFYFFLSVPPDFLYFFLLSSFHFCVHLTILF